MYPYYIADESIRHILIELDPRHAIRKNQATILRAILTADPRLVNQQDEDV